MEPSHPKTPPDSVAPSPAWVPPLLASLTLGLAPFTPEPHLVEKLRWIAAGAAGMRPIDWFDVVMHGAPWAWLAWTLVRTRAASTPRSAP